MIEIFYNLDLFESFNNINIMTNKLRKENVIISNDSNSLTNYSFYINLLELNNKYMVTYTHK